MNQLLRQLVQYFLIAAVAFGVDFGVYLSLITGGVGPLAAAPVGFFAGLMCNYFLAIRFVFFHRRLANHATEFLVYGVIGVWGAALNELIIYVLYEHLNASPALSKLLAAGVVFGFNFTARRTALFPDAKVRS